MKISVVIPTLNEEKILPRTLARAVALGFEEVVVVDGGSHDRTCEVVESFGFDVRGSTFDVPEAQTSDPEPRTSNFIFITAPCGRARQMNVGAARSEGDVLLFLHADTELPLEAGLAIRKALRDLAYVGGRFDIRFEPDVGWGWLISRLMNLRSRWTGITTGDHALFVRRAVFEHLGGFLDIPIMEDVEFSRRLKRAGRLAALPLTVITSYRRWHHAGPLRTILLMWCLRLLYWLGASPHTLTRVYTHVR